MANVAREKERAGVHNLNFEFPLPFLLSFSRESVSLPVELHAETFRIGVNDVLQCVNYEKDVAQNNKLDMIIWVKEKEDGRGIYIYSGYKKTLR